MHCVFIAGSRAISRISPQVREKLDSIMNRNIAVVIGDANGADKSVQRYLAEHEYREVTVYCMDSCRNNLGTWRIRHHSGKPGSRHDRLYYGIKDAEMAKDATCGFMLWDGASKGTLTNTLALLSSGKSVVLYISPKRRIFELRSLRDFHQALNETGITDVSQFLESMGVRPATSEQPRLVPQP